MDYYDIVTLILAGLTGLAVGSFLNVVVYRVPEGMSLASPPSHCPKCGYRLKWYDNIPLFSYLILGGRCRSCRARISFRYTAVELLNAATWLASVLLFWRQSIPYAVVSALVCSVLLCVFFIDLERQLIYNVFLWILGGLAIAAMLLDPSRALLPSLIASLIGGAAGFAVFGGLRLLFSKLLGKEALGDGDVFLAGIAGVMLGWERFLLAMLIASFSASVILLILRRARKDEKDRAYPFAPFLCAGTAIALFAGQPIIEGYLKLIGLA